MYGTHEQINIQLKTNRFTGLFSFLTSEIMAISESCRDLISLPPNYYLITELTKQECVT